MFSKRSVKWMDAFVLAVMQLIAFPRQCDKNLIFLTTYFSFNPCPAE